MIKPNWTRTRVCKVSHHKQIFQRWFRTKKVQTNNHSSFQILCLPKSTNSTLGRIQNSFTHYPTSVWKSYQHHAFVTKYPCLILTETHYFVSILTQTLSIKHTKTNAKTKWLPAECAECVKLHKHSEFPSSKLTSFTDYMMRQSSIGWHVSSSGERGKTKGSVVVSGAGNNKLHGFIS